MNPVDNFPEFIRWFYQSAVFAAVYATNAQYKLLKIEGGDPSLVWPVARETHAAWANCPEVQAFRMTVQNRNEVAEYNSMLFAGLYNRELTDQICTLKGAFSQHIEWNLLYAEYLGLTLGETARMPYAEIFERIRVKLNLPKIPGQP